VLLYAEGLARILEQESSIEVTGATARPEDAIEAVTRGRVEVMLMDLQPPEGPEVARRVRAAAPAVKVVALAVPEDDDEIIAWAEAGMQGFLPRDGSLEDLVAMIQHVARGETICSPRVAATLVRRVATLAGSGERSPAAAAPARLTSREMDIVRLVAAGLSNKEIARSLCIALPTVKNHIHNVLETLQVHRRSEAPSAVLRLREPAYGSRVLVPPRPPEAGGPDLG